MPKIIKMKLLLTTPIDSRENRTVPKNSGNFFASTRHSLFSKDSGFSNMK